MRSWVSRMSDKDPLAELARLEDRVKNAESRIPQLEAELTQAKKELIEQSGRLAKYIAFTHALADVFPPLSEIVQDPSRTLEVHDPIAIVSVQDLSDPVKVDTQSIQGQIAQCIVEEYVTSKRMRVSEVHELLQQHFNSKVGKGEVQAALEKLTEPPFRLFVHEVDNQKRHFFTLTRPGAVRKA